MLVVWEILLFILLFFNAGYSVSTGYIGDLSFEKLENYSLSNVSFLEDGSIELAKDVEEIFNSEDMMWCILPYNDGFLVGTGEKGELIFISRNTKKTVFSSGNHLLFSDVKRFKDIILIAALPDSTIFALDKNFKLVKQIKLESKFVWKIIPYENGFIVLTGGKASLHFFDKELRLIKTLDFPEEKNLLGGLIYKNSLLFYSDSNILYELNLKTKIPEAIASFENNVVDISVYGDRIFILTGRPPVSEQPSQTQKKEESSGDTDDIRDSIQLNRTSGDSGRVSQGSSILYSFDSKEKVREIIFKKEGISFNSMSIIGDRIFIGTDKDGGFYEYDISKSTYRFTSLGKGKFLRLVALDEDLYAIMLEPTRIYKILSGYAKNGFVESDLFDCSIPSKWGEIFLQSEIPAGGEIKIYTKTGASRKESYWDDWALAVSNKILSRPNRYIKYRIEFKSDGKTSPRIRNIVIPFLQNNVAPYIEDFSLKRNENKLQFSWRATDDNKDILSSEVFLKREEGEFFRINEESIEGNLFEIPLDQIPDGVYYAKLTVSDKNSNFLPKESFKIIGPFIVDTTPPDVGEIKVYHDSVSFEVIDNLSPIKSVSYSINGGRWEKIQPLDGIYDSKVEKFKVKINKDTIFIRAKLTDIYGNTKSVTVYKK